MNWFDIMTSTNPKAILDKEKDRLVTKYGLENFEKITNTIIENNYGKLDNYNLKGLESFDKDMVKEIFEYIKEGREGAILRIKSELN